jgi:hypothetical protein
MSTTYYIVATRNIAGKLNPDWDGELHDNIEDGKAALAASRSEFDNEERARNYAVLLQCQAVDA